jgi:hypothetical protein
MTSDCFYERFRLTLRLSARIVADAEFSLETALNLRLLGSGTNPTSHYLKTAFTPLCFSSS